MKKIFLLIGIFTFCLSTSVNAVGYTSETYANLNVSNAYVCGDYIFDVSNGFQPTLRDYMKAARSIPEGEETTLYSIQSVTVNGVPSLNVVEVFSGMKYLDENVDSGIKLINPKYLFRTSIFDNSPDYDELS